ncbi:MAG: transcription termination/antitermination protein NusA [Treponema sp.]|nr:transcription termination/antitermination protein NusA [Treponema sp.]
MADQIRAVTESKGVSEESVKRTIENAIKAAYKRTYGQCDNCIVKFSDDLSDVLVYSRKTIVDGVYDPSLEIELEDALKLSSECEEGDEIDILEDPKTWERSAVSTGKQTAHQGLNESFKDNLYAEYKDKVGEIIIGYYQREHNGSIYVDLGKVEGVLPGKYQSPREVYEKNDRIKALITDIKRTNNGIQLVLSRTSPDFVEKILELEVPEIADKTIGVFKIVREPGYRTKIAVYSNKAGVDPVGSCVGLKGQRIQNVIRELEGEKIDVFRYDEDPHAFIANALSPAQVSRVVILDSEKREALAIVSDEGFSLAIGKQGQNVRLANRLCDWSIDVKTEEQVAGMDLTENDTSRRAAEELFGGAAADAGEDVISTVAQLPGVDERVADLLKSAGLDDIEVFVNAVNDGTAQQVEGISADDIEALSKIINENVEFADESDEAENSEEEYFCPDCGAKITLDMKHCPKCGVELVFEED